jgi:hypothetical protein
MADQRYLTIKGAAARYPAKPSAWRKWVSNGQLGVAVVRFGRLVFVDSVILDERISRSGQLLVAPVDATVVTKAGGRR